MNSTYKPAFDSNDLYYALEDEYESNLEWVMNKYKLKNYFLKEYYESWDTLIIDEKLEYCLDLFDLVNEDEFPALRMMEIFQRLIHVDLNFFDYVNVIECIFPDSYNTMGLVHTIQVTFNPLIPQKKYDEYFKKLRKKSGLKKFNVPSENTSEYFKNLFKIWFYHKHMNMSAYSIADTYYFLDEQKEIQRKINTIKKLYNYRQ